MFYFHPYLGKISNLTNIFQMGSNHQLVQVYRGFNPSCPFMRLLHRGNKKLHVELVGGESCLDELNFIEENGEKDDSA